MGGVAYITKCVPLTAHIRPFKNCSHEIPIVLPNNAEVFMDPISRIVVYVPDIGKVELLFNDDKHFNGEYLFQFHVTQLLQSGHDYLLTFFVVCKALHLVSNMGLF